MTQHITQMQAVEMARSAGLLIAQRDGSEAYQRLCNAAIRHYIDTQPPSAAAPETMTLAQVWVMAGGNPGISPTRADVEIALTTFDEICDERPQPSAAAPEGWKLVPIEPTEAMVIAGGHANSEWLNDSAPIGEKRYAMPMPSVYKDMLAAAPPAPTTKPVPLTDEQVCKMYRKAALQDHIMLRSDYESGVRDAEAAHGIKEPTT